MHHIAFELKDWAHVEAACDIFRATYPADLGTRPHGIGHNVFTYHRNRTIRSPNSSPNSTRCTTRISALLYPGLDRRQAATAESLDARPGAANIGANRRRPLPRIGRARRRGGA